MKSSASVRLGAAPVSHVPVLTACVPASGRSRLEITVTASRNGSSGLRIGLNSKPAPVVVGFQWLGRSPIGTKTAPNRRVGAAAVRTIGVIAGTIASSIGRAKRRSQTTKNRSTRQRLFRDEHGVLPVVHSSRFATRDALVCGALDPHLEWYAPDDAQHNGREPVAVTLRVAGNRAHGGHVRRRPGHGRAHRSAAVRSTFARRSGARGPAPPSAR